MSLIEVIVVTGIISVIMLAMLTMQSNQMKSNNYLEFQLKRTQLHGTLVGQFLKDSNNCACLFNGASSFPAAGTASLSGVTPTQIGLYTSAAPGCGAPAQFFINATGIDGLAATSIQLQNIAPTADPNIYTGSFNINIRSTKDVLGPSDLPISIPVSISTTPAGANVNFMSCGLTAAAPPALPLTVNSEVNIFSRCNSTWTLPCVDPAQKVTSCGIIRGQLANNNEDQVYCSLDVTSNTCRFTYDAWSGCDNESLNWSVECYCR